MTRRDAARPRSARGRCDDGPAARPDHRDRARLPISAGSGDQLRGRCRCRVARGRSRAPTTASAFRGHVRGRPDAGLPATWQRRDLGVQTVRLDGGSTTRSGVPGRRAPDLRGTYHEEDGLLVFDDETGMYCGGNWGHPIVPGRCGDQPDARPHPHRGRFGPRLGPSGRCCTAKPWRRSRTSCGGSVAGGCRPVAGSTRRTALAGRAPTGDCQRNRADDHDDRGSRWPHGTEKREATPLTAAAATTVRRDPRGPRRRRGT